MTYKDEDCLRALREAVRRLGRSPSRLEYEAMDITPASTTIRSKLGGWNKAKELAGLETYTESDGGSDEILPKPGWVELPDGYEWEEMTPQQRWYYQHREHRIELVKRRKLKLRQWLFDYKLERCECERCGIGDPPCLDFHHVGDKTHDVSRMVNRGHSKASIIEEIDRCIVLCSNCHRKEHADDRDSRYRRLDIDGELDEVLSRTFQFQYPEGSSSDERKELRRLAFRDWINDYKIASGGCTRCPEGDPICLEFHHVDEDRKSVPIGQLISWAISKERILEEVEKCELVCRNCHRKEHHEPPSSWQRTED